MEGFDFRGVTVPPEAITNESLASAEMAKTRNANAIVQVFIDAERTPLCSDANDAPENNSILLFLNYRL